MINNGAIPRSWREAAAYAQTPMSSLRAAIKRGAVPAPTKGSDGKTLWDLGALDALRAARVGTAPGVYPVNATASTVTPSVASSASLSRSLQGSLVHLLGVSYKENVGDLRESPALKLIELLRAEGADVSYTDAHVPELPEHGLSSVDLDGVAGRADCVVIVTAHAGLDYPALAGSTRLLVDLRNATGAAGAGNRTVWKL